MNTCLNHENCVHNAMLQAQNVCEQKGLRFTEHRKNVLRLIWATHGPSKAYDILNKMDNGKAKPPTVYRAINFLLENRLIHKLNSLNAYIGCTHPNDSHECYFLICQICDEVQECCNQKLSITIAGTANDKQFIPEQTTLEISGLCQNCQLAKNKPI